MATETKEPGVEAQSSVWKRVAIGVGAVVGVAIVWFLVISFSLGLAEGMAADNAAPGLIAVSAGVFAGPVVFVLFDRLADFLQSLF